MVLTLSVLCEFRAIIQLVWDGFWVVFIQQLYSKLKKLKITCPIDAKVSGKVHWHKSAIPVPFGCKRLSMRKVIAL